MNALYNTNGNLKRNTWKNIDNHKIFAELLAVILGYTTPEDWYNISHKDIKINKGHGLLARYYKDSPILFVKTIVRNIYPEYEWLDWNFNKTPQGYWDNKENQRKFMDWLGKKLSYETMEDWYKLNIDIIRDHNVGGLLSKYSSSHIALLISVYPEYKWLEWKFKYTSNQFWHDTDNHKEYAAWLMDELKYTKIEDWYNVTQNIIKNNYGSGMLEYYQGSPIQFLRAVYPNHEWLEWKFGMSSNGFWQDTDNHKTYAEWLGKELKYTELEHWYNITHNIIHNNCGGGLLAGYYEDSPIQFLRAVYPNHEWLEWKFGMSSNGFWQDTNNHKKYAEWLGKEMKYTEPEDWYKVTQNIIHDNCGCGILNYYQGSPMQFLIAVYPEYEWLAWKFISTPNGFWQDTNNHKKYALWLGKEMKYTEPEHWYKVTQNIIHDNCGCGMLNYYQGSPMQFLIAVYPEYEWLAWKFISTPNGFWQDLTNHKKYALWLGKEMKYTEPEHWYNVTTNIIHANYGGGILHNYSSYTEIPKLVYPDYNWDNSKFCFNKTEAKLYEILLPLYCTLITQFTPEWIKPKRYDFCIPELKTIIELDGRQHFQQVSNWPSPEVQFQNDKYKQKCAKENGYSVIRLLQEDVLYDRNDWCKKVDDAIEEIKNSDEPKNIYLCENNEYYRYK
jgi:very-short-patch-repair endonuclease